MLCYAMLCEDTHARMCEAHTFVRSLGDNKMPRLLIMPIYKPWSTSIFNSMAIPRVALATRILGVWPRASDDWFYATLGAAGVIFELGNAFHQDCQYFESSVIVSAANILKYDRANQQGRLLHLLERRVLSALYSPRQFLR
jgi:hypothetical protein